MKSERDDWFLFHIWRIQAFFEEEDLDVEVKSSPSKPVIPVIPERPHNQTFLPQSIRERLEQIRSRHRWMFEIGSCEMWCLESSINYDFILHFDLKYFLKSLLGILLSTFHHTVFSDPILQLVLFGMPFGSHEWDAISLYGGRKLRDERLGFFFLSDDVLWDTIRLPPKLLNIQRWVPFSPKISTFLPSDFQPASSDAAIDVGEYGLPVHTARSPPYMP
jgi:hypothetical protein